MHLTRRFLSCGQKEPEQETERQQNTESNQYRTQEFCGLLKRAHEFGNHVVNLDISIGHIDHELKRREP